MFQEKENNGFVNKTQHCSWVCRRLGDVGKFLSSLKIEPAGSMISGAGNLMSTIEDMIFNKISIQDLTPSEEVILTAWDEKFLPFVKTLATQHQNALLQSNEFNRVTAINAVLVKMAVVQKHYLTNETSGLSMNAQSGRTQYIEEIFGPLRKLIEDKMANSEYKKATVNYNYVPMPEYSSLFQTSNIKTVSTTQFSKITPSFGTVETMPLPSTNVPVPNVLPAGTGISDSINEVKPTTEKTFLQKNGVWLGIAAVAFWALKPEKKKSKSK